MGMVRNSSPLVVSLHQLFNDHITRYPLMQVQDLYKLLHQAALGSGHAVQDETSARKWLETELAGMREGPDEPLLDPISPDGAVSRLHLRPCLKAGVEPRVIWTAFVRTANEWQGSTLTLREYGQAAARLAKADHWHLEGLEIEAYFATMEGKGYPAVHHSSIYAERYRPAYRVVKTDIWRQYESLHFPP